MSRRPGRWSHGLGTTDAPGGKAGVDPPSVHGDADHENLLRGLVALWLSCLACALTFLLIGQVWANHHVMFDHIRTAGRDVLMTRRPSRNHHLRICRCAQRSARLAGRRPGFASTVHGRGAHDLIPDLDDALA